ncbi:uncharacterized protein LOC100376557 [Saccoglossus kowalevskii]
MAYCHLTDVGWTQSPALRCSKCTEPPAWNLREPPCLSLEDCICVWCIIIIILIIIIIIIIVIICIWKRKKIYNWYKQWHNRARVTDSSTDVNKETGSTAKPNSPEDTGDVNTEMKSTAKPTIPEDTGEVSNGDGHSIAVSVVSQTGVSIEEP